MTPSEWIDEKIREEEISFFRYDEFMNLEKVGEGELGIVNRADWESGKIKIALKAFTNKYALNELDNENKKNDMERLIKELKILRRVGFHPNINQFYGITKEPESNNYVMVLQYANQGNLGKYLKNNFKSLLWSDKIRMASEIACGLKYLHSTKIIHRNLHAKNILVHNGILMIADLGLAKVLTVESSSNSVVNRISAYVEPQCYKYDNYVRDERSDIYSLGVLLWEITSGYPPFSKNSTHKDTSLTFKIINGHREKPIINTPKAYVNLYQRCWDEDPNLRPTVNEVFVILEELYKTIPKIMEDVIENNSDKNKQTLNNNQNNLKLSYLENPLSESPSFFTPNINNDEIKHINDATDEIIDSYLKRNRIGWTKNFSFPKVLEEHESKSEKIFGNLINNQTIRQYEVMVGYFYENGFGVGKNEIVAFEWYKKASEMNNINGHFELGYCYNYGYSIKRSLKEAIRLYKFSSDEGLNVATYFLANNYEFDNQKNNFNEAFKLYKKSAENGFIPSQYKLATFYEEGKGTQQNKKEALKWYKRFLENGGEHSETYNIKDNKLEKSLPIELIVDGIEKELIRNKLDEIIQAYLKRNKIGQTGIFSFSEVLKNYESKSREIFKCLYHNQTIRHYEVMMGKFYEKGFGTDKNNDKAIEWYMEAIKQNDINGIFEAGNCYYNGYGVEKNRNKAFEFIQRVVNDNTEELNIALYYLASCYNSGDGVRKKNETNQQLLREHQVKAFKLYKKSAENGFVQSQYELAECYKNGIGTQKNKDEASKWVEKYKESYVDSFSYDHKRLKNDEIFRVSYDIEKIEKEKEQERQNVEIQKQEEFLTPTLVLAKINFDSQNITQEILTRKSTSLPQISGITKIMIKDIKLNEQLKLNHGLFLDGHNVLASKKAIFAEGGELNISTYNGQPLVYTIVNLEQSDLYINFPIAEIIYRGDLITTFSRCTDCNENLHKFYGHVFARKVLIGDKLFIKNFNSATSAEIDILKFCLVCAYNSAIHSKRIPFNNLFTLDLLPKIVSSNDEELSTYEKLIEWMNDLYITGEKSGLIVSYDDLVPVSQLRETSSLDEFFNENQLENVQFKKLGLEEWVGDAMNDNLTSWTGDFRLFQGLIFNKNYEIKISKKIAINFIEIPEVKTSDKSYLKIINPSTKLEVVLNSNNIFSLKNLDFFNIDNTKSYRGYTHVLIKCEQYEILFNKENVKPTEEFERVIEEALNNMKPLKALRDIFNEYGHLFPQRIILGRSLKNILSPSISSDTIDIRPESLISHLDKLNISYFITPKGNIIENDNLINWIQNPNNLEIIEFDKVDPLYKILKKEQQRKISDLLQNNYKILMTGITDLRDLDDNDIKYYKRINIEPSLEDEDYEVFGSIISNSNPRVEGIYVNFGSYDFNGFFAMIKKLEKTSVIIKECYILWMIVEKPSESLIFSPSNRDFQVNCIKRSITLQPSITNYLIKTSFKLSQGYTIFVHAYYPITNYEPDNIIRLIGWSDNLFIFQITKSNNETIINEAISMQLHICVLCSDYKNLKIDNKNNEEYSLNLIGHILTLENFSETCEAD
ncbi:hypothetical protein RclHR1_04300015 [Rhizophagus clarus]|uniref:Protein kinase domain-containing protein n=1 Tax=Rhizophagus clarus TaxID=94130 RepID=A0A2Z6RL29_9GLOM|nr:hypothetical protein RclHR1_04300015 [Rhizophagus clarus]